MKTTTQPTQRTLIRVAVLFGLALFSTCLVQAEPIEQTVDDLDWNEAMWGAGPDTPTAGNDYISATGGTNRFRISADGGSDTFGGDNLTVVSGTSALIKTQNGATSTITGNLILDGGTLWYAPNSGSASTLAANNFVIDSNSFIDVARQKDLFTMDGTLTGSGNLDFTIENPSSSSSGSSILITDVSNYTGAITVNSSTSPNLTLGFGVDYFFENSFSLQNEGAQLNLQSGRTLTFGQGMLSDFVNGTVAPGTYSAGDLGANYVGDGTVTVIPEPGTIVLMLTALGAVFVFRRKR